MTSRTQNGPKPISRIPILLSAFICPGGGQFAQRRWIAGTLFFTTFSAAFVVFMVVAGRLIVSYYRMGFELETYEPDVHPGRLLPAFMVATVIYVINLLDVTFAYFRTCRETAKKQFYDSLRMN